MAAGEVAVHPGAVPVEAEDLKPLGFTLEETCDLLQATDRLRRDRGNARSRARRAPATRQGTYERTAAKKIEDLRVQLARAEDFAPTLRTRLEQTTRP